MAVPPGVPSETQSSAPSRKKKARSPTIVISEVTASSSPSSPVSCSVPSGVPSETQSPPMQPRKTRFLVGSSVQMEQSSTTCVPAAVPSEVQKTEDCLKTSLSPRAWRPWGPPKSLKSKRSVVPSEVPSDAQSAVPCERLGLVPRKKTRSPIAVSSDGYEPSVILGEVSFTRDVPPALPSDTQSSRP